MAKVNPATSLYGRMSAVLLLLCLLVGIGAGHSAGFIGQDGAPAITLGASPTSLLDVSRHTALAPASAVQAPARSKLWDWHGDVAPHHAGELRFLAIAGESCALGACVSASGTAWERYAARAPPSLV